MTQGVLPQTQGWTLLSADGLHAIPDEQGRYELLARIIHGIDLDSRFGFFGQAQRFSSEAMSGDVG